MSLRTDQVASVIQRAVQSVLTRGLHDPRVRGLISVTKVEVDPDLSEARVFISVLPEEQAALTMHGLQHAARHLQAETSKSVRLRRMPRLQFRHDPSIKKETEVLAAIDRSRREAAQPERENGEAIAPGEESTP